MEIEMKARVVGTSPATNGIIVLLESPQKKLILTRVDMRSVPMTELLEKNAAAQSAQPKSTLKKIVVTDLIRDHALLYLEKNGATTTSDAKLGDAIALALRTESPIYVESAALEDYIKACSFPDAPGQKEWFDALDPNDLPNDLPKE